MSRLVSSSTISVFLPPNSKDPFLKWRPASSPTLRPTEGEPVNAIIATFGSLHSAAPASPAPGGTCSTPSGKPASANSCAMTAYNERTRAEAAISRFKRVVGDELRSRTDRRRATEVDVAVHALNRMLEPGRPTDVRTA